MPEQERAAQEQEQRQSIPDHPGERQPVTPPGPPGPRTEPGGGQPGTDGHTTDTD